MRFIQAVAVVTLLSTTSNVQAQYGGNWYTPGPFPRYYGNYLITGGGIKPLPNYLPFGNGPFTSPPFGWYPGSAFNYSANPFAPGFGPQPMTPGSWRP